MPHTKLIQSFAAIVGGDAVLTGEPAAPYLHRLARTLFGQCAGGGVPFRYADRSPEW